MAKTRREAIAVPQSREACDALIAELGRERRKLDGIELGLKQSTAELKDKAEGAAAPVKERIALLAQQVEAYCAAHRERLTDGGKTKTVEFAAGTVSWRQRPAAVSFKRGTKVDEVLAFVLGAGARFRKFVRISRELNKEAMLAAPELATEIPGVSIGSGGETFAIEPAALAIADERRAA